MKKIFSILFLSWLIIPLEIARGQAGLAGYSDLKPILDDALFRDQEPASSSNLGPIMGDALFHPSKLTETWSNEPAGAPARAPGRFRETSEYMIGRIAVGIILPESNGSIDSPQTENWASAEENAVKAEIEAGLNWWVAREPTAQLEFITDFHFRAPTGYEPIQRPQSDEGLWISEVMTNLGYPGTNYMDQVYEYNNALREEKGADWAYTIFVVDSSADGDGRFTDGYFAYAWVGGPFLMLTYDNNGYGISNMDAVCAHETGHIFYALDQYAESGCSPTENSGYLAAPNSNCANGGTSYECIMRGGVRPYTSGKISPSTREQIGWRDSDSDGILDIVDINPETSLTPFSPDPTINPTPIYTGSAQTGTPYPNNNPYNPYGSGRSDININIIAGVEYRHRLNAGAWSEWSSAAPGEGAFDSEEEGFTFTPSPLTRGTYNFEVRALNRFGNADLSPATDQLTIDGEDIPPTCVFTQPESLAWYNGPINLAALAQDSDGVVTQVEFDYSLNGSTWYACAGSPVTTSPYHLSWETFPVGEVNESVSLRARARDNQGLYSEYSRVQIKVDNKSPEFSSWVNTPSDLTEDSIGSFQIQVEITDEGIGPESEIPGIDYRIGINPFDGYEEMTRLEGNTWVFNIPEPADGWNSSGGQYLEYKVEAKDSLGNTSVSQVRQELIDEVNFPPVVYLTSPQPLTWNQGAINLSAEASDTDGSITRVEFFYSLDGLIWYNCIGGLDTTYPYEASWASLPAEGVDESVGLRVRAKDNEGLYSTYSEVQIKIDNEGPLLSNWIQVPEDLAADHSGPLSIMVTVSEEGVGLQDQVPGLDYRIGSLPFDGYEEMTLTGGLSRPGGPSRPGGNTWSFDIPAPDGGWTIYGEEYLRYKVEVSDGLGNTTTSEVREEFIEGIIEPLLPDCRLTSPVPSAWYAGAVNLTAEALDTDGPSRPSGAIIQVEFAWSMDGATWYPVQGSPDTTYPYSLIWDSSSLVQADESVGLRARATDNQGLYSGYHEVQIKIDNIPPVLANRLQVPFDLTDTYSGPVRITVDVFDEGAGLLDQTPMLDYQVGLDPFAGYREMSFEGGSAWFFDIPEPGSGWGNYSGGYLTYRIAVNDAVGNTTLSDLHQELIERIDLPPACELTSPDPLIWYAGTINLTAEAHDSDGVITQVEFDYSLDGITWYPVPGSPDINYPYSLAWDSLQFISETNQNLHIRSRALDSQELYSAYAEVTIKVDNKAPEFSNWDNIPADLTADYTGSFQISLAILDEGIGLSEPPEISYRTGSATFSDYQEMSLAGPSRPGGDNIRIFNIPEPVDGWAAHAGEYLEYRVTSRDSLGNMAASDLQRELIQAAQQVPPQCRLLFPSAFSWYAGSINLLAEASSSTNTISQVEFAYSQDGLTWQTEPAWQTEPVWRECAGSPVSVSPYSLLWQTIPSDGVDTQVYLRARSLDSTGSYSDWDIIEIMIDNQPPAFQSFDHTPSALTNKYTGNVSIDVAVMDIGSGLEVPRWDWRIDGEAYTGYKLMDFRAEHLYTGVIPEPVQGWIGYAGEYIYYRIKASDRTANTAFSPEHKILIETVEQSPPVLDWVALEEEEALIRFQDESLPLDLSEASFELFETDHPDIVFTLTNPVLDQIDRALIHLPLVQLEGGRSYVLKIEGVKDAVGNRSPSALEREFTPVLPNLPVTVVKEDGTGIEIDPGTFDRVVSLEINLNPQIPELAPQSGGETSSDPELIPGTCREYEARGADGALLGEDDFNQPVRIRIPYPATEDGRAGLAGNNLKIYYLDEAASKWVEPAGEQETDHNSHLITASVPHLSIFGIARDTSSPVEPPSGGEFIAYPNPFRGPDGHKTINFKGPGEQAKIRIFSLSGQVVKELGNENWDGKKWSWEVGSNLANGLYIYLILDSGAKKVDKLAIVR
ncbi:MAG: Ig-like domain-containing protein [bacterium]|nr:Ig-like domain-containing protein [bacterium]